jgi:hypothetical protein
MDWWTVTGTRRGIAGFGLSIWALVDAMGASCAGSSDTRCKNLNLSHTSKTAMCGAPGVGPISYGIRHYERYVDEHPVLLRINGPVQES